MKLSKRPDRPAARAPLGAPGPRALTTAEALTSRDGRFAYLRALWRAVRHAEGIAPRGADETDDFIAFVKAYGAEKARLMASGDLWGW